MTAFKLVAVVLTVAVVSTSAVVAVAVWDFNKTVDDNAIDITDGDAVASVPQLESYENGFNVLLVGIDNDATQSAAYGEREGTLNDVNILVHVSADHTNAVVVSIPRDLIVPHPECTDATSEAEFSAMAARPVNEAMSRGGLPCVVKTVSELTGLTIPYAGLISFDGVVQMSDAVGGVPICLNAAINDPAAGLDLPAGTSIVAGDTALAFLRSRKGVGDRSDLARISSQQIYMASLMRTVQGNGTLTSIPTLINLANAAATNIKLSTSLADTDTMVSMALALQDIDLDRLLFVQYPGTTEDFDFPGKVVPREKVAAEMFTKLDNDEPFILPGTTPTPEPTPNAQVPVETSTPTSTPTPSETAAPAPQPTVQALDGLTGQTAQDDSCAQASAG
ncbi:LytR family transcriptional regulator [Cryobacterium melibiosiphilum]|uniref:LytR family transcriptional regulator n=1 Tax=Cryobacterium melibiosiphilum TaxID=995039 RepID=A0A3A5MRE9_9MICO|nr:LCP family protein [Cryobacterium melibiosiphilum]RJT91555.1 LytR family transcriptional regulator [Cryobacterium melibiosiphilum]